jgi:hypothetical protein
VTSPRTYEEREIKPLRPSPTFRDDEDDNNNAAAAASLPPPCPASPSVLHRSLLLALLLLLSSFELVTLLPVDDGAPNKHPRGRIPSWRRRNRSVHADDGVKTAASNYLRGLRQAQNGERKTGYSCRCASPSSPVPQDGGGRLRLTTTTTTTAAHVCRLQIKSLSPRSDEPSVKRRRLCYSLGTSADAETA